jgi:phage baseplate assembly protein W
MPQQINPNLNAKPVPIGLNIPIKRGKAGYFDLNYDSVSQVKANIKNLLNTVRGERRFQPLFGSGLHNAIFEQNLQETPDILKEIIINDINTWIPNITVTDVELSMTNMDNNQLKDIYTVYIKVTFTVNNVTDSVDLILQQNRI